MLNHFNSKVLQQIQNIPTPFYLYDEEKIVIQCSLINQCLVGGRSNLFALKANSNPYLVGLIKQQGFGLDVVSPEELMFSLQMGFQPSKILYTAFAPKNEDMSLVVKNKVLINIESVEALERYGIRHPNTNVCLRVNTCVEGGFHAKVVTSGAKTKFGIMLDDLHKAYSICNKYNLRLVGLHAHVGSNVRNYKVLLKSMQRLLDVALDCHMKGYLEFLNFGGGLGVQYQQGDQKLDIEALGSELSKKFSVFCTKLGRKISYMLEPGRFLVAESGSLITQVVDIKRNKFYNFACVDTGFNHLIRPAMYDAYHEIIPIEPSKEGKELYEFAGNVCETGDILGSKRLLPKLQNGDLVEICTVGAYGFYMASTYNMRSLPGQYVITSSSDIKAI